METPALPLDAAAIEAIIPHRPPFRFVDEIHELEPGVRASGRHVVPADAWYLTGHFPGNPIVPGVIMVEAAAQVGAVCALTHPDYARRFGVFAAIDEVRFTRIVRPGDVLELAVEVERVRGRIAQARAVIRVGSDRAVAGKLTFALLEEPPQ